MPMPPRLKLTIIEPSDFEGEQIKVVEAGPFRIGREPDNDWVLVDEARAISRHHLSIDIKSGVFVLTDTSANGVFINGAERAVGRGNSAILSDGDVIRFADFSISLALQEHDDPARDPFRAVLPPEAGDDLSEPDLTLPQDWERPQQAFSDFGFDSVGEPHPHFTPGIPMMQSPMFDPSPAGWRATQVPPFPTKESWSSATENNADQLLPNLWARQSEAEHVPAEKQIFESALPTPVVIPEDWDVEDSISPVPSPSVPTMVAVEENDEEAFHTKIQAMATAFARLERVLIRPGDDLLFRGDGDSALDRISMTPATTAVAIINRLTARSVAAIMTGRVVSDAMLEHDTVSVRNDEQSATSGAMTSDVLQGSFRS